MRQYKITFLVSLGKQIEVGALEHSFCLRLREAGGFKGLGRSYLWIQSGGGFWKQVFKKEGVISYFKYCGKVMEEGI